MMPTFYIIIKGGGGKNKIGGTHNPRRIARPRGAGLFWRGREASSSFVSTSDATHVTHKTNEQTKKKKNKKKREGLPSSLFLKKCQIPFFFGQQQFWTLDDDDDERKVLRGGGGDKKISPKETIQKKAVVQRERGRRRG